MKLFKLDNKMLVFIIIGLSLIFMAVYTYYYVSVNTSAIILIVLLVYGADIDKVSVFTF